MKKPFTIFVVSSFALSLFTGCRKKEDPVKIIEQAEAKLPPSEQMPPDAGAPARSATKTKSPAPAPTSDAAFLAATAPPASAGATGAADYEAWFKKYQLDLNDPRMLDQDADGDGSSNRDEFMANTNPRDANSRPTTHEGLRLKEYTEVRLPVILEEVSGDTARIRRLDGEERVETVKAGQTIKGLKWKVEKLATKQDVDKHGDPVDLSSLTLTDNENNQRAVLMRNLPTRTGDSFAELTSADGAKTLKVKQDETFKWPDENGATYKVIDLRADQVVVQDVATRKMWTIQKQ
jgi:hypothetical protein